MRGSNEGRNPWDLQPDSTRTNANVEAMVDTANGRELSLTYKGGAQKILIPEGTPIVAFTPSDKSMLKPGAHVFVVTQAAADGTLTAARVNVGRDGLKPPM